MTNNEKNVGFNGDQIEPSRNEGDGELQHASIERPPEQAEHLDENKENREASARHEIEQVTAEKEARTERTAERMPVERPKNTRTARKKAYASIMKQTQAELPTTSRTFSKVIHNPVIERVSEIAGNTIARPNAMLSGALCAFIITLLIYIIARANGYPLSGSETIAGFVTGWVLGILYDFFKVMVTGKK